MSDKTRMCDATSPDNQDSPSLKELIESNKDIECGEDTDESSQQTFKQKSSDKIIEPEEKTIVTFHRSIHSEPSTSKVQTFQADQLLHKEELSYSEVAFEENKSEELSEFKVISINNESPLNDQLSFHEKFWKNEEQPSYQEPRIGEISAKPLSFLDPRVDKISSQNVHSVSISLDKPRETYDIKTRAEAKEAVLEVWNDMFDTFWTFYGEFEPEELDSIRKQWIEDHDKRKTNLHLGIESTQLHDINLVIGELKILEEKICQQELGSIDVRRRREDKNQNKKYQSTKWEKKCEDQRMFYEKRRHALGAKLPVESSKGKGKKVRFNIEADEENETENEKNIDAAIINSQNKDNEKKLKPIDNSRIEWKSRLPGQRPIFESNYPTDGINRKPKATIKPMSVFAKEPHYVNDINKVLWQNRLQYSCSLFETRCIFEENVLREQWKYENELRLNMDLTPAMKLLDKLSITDERRVKRSDEEEYDDDDNNESFQRITLTGSYPDQNSWANTSDQKIDLTEPQSVSAWSDTDGKLIDLTAESPNRRIVPAGEADVDLSRKSPIPNLWPVENSNDSLTPYTTAGFKDNQKSTVESFDQSKKITYAEIQVQKFVTDQAKEAKENAAKMREIEQKILNNLKPSHNQLMIPEDENIIYLQMLSEDTAEYSIICEKFHTTTDEAYTILRIANIVNPYLKVAYKLRKEEYNLTYGTENVHDMMVFRGMKRGSDVESIMVHNWNWRLYIEEDNHHGVEFSSMAKYALKDCDNDGDKVMAVALIIVTDSDFANGKAELNEPSDQILAKFRDDEYCPGFVVYFM